MPTLSVVRVLDFTENVAVTRDVPLKVPTLSVVRVLDFTEKLALSHVMFF